jgi:hypothetical protein
MTEDQQKIIELENAKTALKQLVIAKQKAEQELRKLR